MKISNGNLRNKRGELSYDLAGTYKFHATEKNGNLTANEDIINRNKDMILVTGMVNPVTHSRVIGDIFVVNDLKTLLTRVSENSNSASPKIGVNVSTLYPGGKYFEFVSTAHYSDELPNDHVLARHETKKVALLNERV